MIISQPQYLWLLLLVPLFFIAQWVVLMFRQRRIRRFGDEELVKTLMPSYAKGKVWLRLTCFALAFSMLVLAMSRPQRGLRLKEYEVRGAEVIIALDVSNSMLAVDDADKNSYNRLRLAKLAISNLAESLEGDRLGLILFAGESDVLLPLTEDYVSAKIFLNGISTNSIPVQGTAIGSAIDLAMNSFSADSDKSRAIIVISDGENHEDDAVEAAAYAAENGVRVFTVGVGDPKGVLIPLPEGGYIEDENGKRVLTKLNVEALTAIAQAGNGLYKQAHNVDFGLEDIINEIKKMDDEVVTRVAYEEYEELYMYFVAAALFFLVLQMLVGDRRSGVQLFRR